MKAWSASFELAQERLIHLLLGALATAWLGWTIERWGNMAVLPGELAAIPVFWGIGNPLVRLAILASALWLVLSIAVTVKIRLDIRRHNYVRPKQ